MANTPPSFLLGSESLTVKKALSLANGSNIPFLSDETRERVNASANLVERIVEDAHPVYGINTGFGPLCTTKISKDETRQLQENILKSHAVGLGRPISNQLSKLMLITKAHALSKGYSGIKLTTLERIIWHIENDALPVVPSQGSVGASGDLAPLAHLFLPLIGLGEVHYEGQILKGQEFLKTVGLSKLTLGPKEGLALINGTQFILAHSIVVLDKMHNCLTHADIVGAMMIEGLQGSLKPFDPALHQLRPFKGNLHVAARVRSLLEGSEILEDHIDCERVQDPYSIRCIPQVHGASRNAWLHVKELVHTELNAVTDNPVLIGEEAISGGNFHGQPLAMALDYACVACAELGNISDRRIYLALEGTSPGLPELLMKDTGINSGYMILQYTSAALASENKSYCFPASADSIPTSMGQEDHVSMGSISGRKALAIIENVEKILSIELLTAAQAFEFRKPLRSGPLMDAVYRCIREHVSFAEEDRVFADDINIALGLLREKTLLEPLLDQAGAGKIALKTTYSDLFEQY
ncbi:MAG: histidine ammonia-lyase [Eudoraea sp.]|nr:histidine ammonia-lyase [Eudoraea sp.]